MEKILQAPSHSSNETFRILCGRDKSLTHRAIMFAALAKGTSFIRQPLLGADCLSTLSCFAALGVQYDFPTPEVLRIQSESFRAFRQPRIPLDCGNSGTTARLILGILSALPGLSCELIGDESLSQRPMKRVTTPLRAMGAAISGRDDGNFLPLKVEGRSLTPRAHEVDKSSAQIKSCLLLAGMLTTGETRVRLPAGSRDHTERVLEGMGARLKATRTSDWEEVSIEGPFEPTPLDVAIPADPSSAAFFAVFGLLRQSGWIELPEVLDNPTRMGFWQVLKRMCPEAGALEQIPSQSENTLEPVATLRIAGGHALRGTTIRPAEVPTLVDEIPILALAAAFAKTPSTFHGLAELRVKESDRLLATSQLLTAIGAAHEIRGDDLHIQGGLQAMKAFRFNPLGDHRLAMSSAIAARLAENPCCILDPECVRVSFPNFFEALESVHAR